MVSEITPAHAKLASPTANLGNGVRLNYECRPAIKCAPFSYENANKVPHP
jgi:hypothetical protein